MILRGVTKISNLFFFVDYISSRIDLVSWWISRKDKSWYEWLIKDSIFVFFFFDSMVPFLIPSFSPLFLPSWCFSLILFSFFLFLFLFVFVSLFFLGSFLIKILIILFPFVLSDSMASKRGLQIKEKSSVYINDILKKVALRKTWTKTYASRTKIVECDL